MLITDYAAIAELMAHGVAADKKEAARMAMEAGVDIDMCTDCYASQLEGLIREGTIRQEQLDAAVWRVLCLKNRLGLFEDPSGRPGGGGKTGISEGILPQPCPEAAVKSSVLLENKEGLPASGANRREIW